MIIYDLEIINAIPPKNGADRNADVRYCEGWHDHANMGVSVLCAFSYRSGRYSVFMQDNLHVFKAGIEKGRGPFVGFNNIAFDNAVLRHAGIDIPAERCYDILVEIWKAAGLSPEFQYPTHLGFGLDAVAKANLGRGKIGDGTSAPEWWQSGQTGKTVNYCLDDVALTRSILDRIWRDGSLIDPRDGKTILRIRRPA